MQKRTTKGETLTKIILKTFRFNGELLSVGNQLTRPYGLTGARWQVMGAIDLEGKLLTVPQIARHMGLTRQAVQRIVNDLIQLDMLILSENPDHKRAPLVSISKAGKAVMKEIDQVQTAWVNDLAKDLAEKHLKQALEVLENVRERTEQFNQTLREK